MKKFFKKIKSAGTTTETTPTQPEAAQATASAKASGRASLSRTKGQKGLSSLLDPSKRANHRPPSSAMHASASSAMAVQTSVSEADLKQAIGDFAQQEGLSASQVDLLVNYMSIEIGAAVLDDKEVMYTADGKLQLHDPDNPGAVNESTLYMVGKNNNLSTAINSHDPSEQFFQQYEQSDLSQKLQSFMDQALSGKEGMHRAFAQGEALDTVQTHAESIKSNAPKPGGQ